MNTSVKTREHSHPTTLAPLGLLDRLALNGGLVLIRWARRSQQPSGVAVRHRATVRDRAQAWDAQTHHRELTEARHRLCVTG